MCTLGCLVAVLLPVKMQKMITLSRFGVCNFRSYRISLNYYLLRFKCILVKLLLVRQYLTANYIAQLTVRFNI